MKARWNAYRALRRSTIALGAMVVAVLPFVASLGLLRWTLGASPSDYVPFHSDELSYWHQANSFAAVGFDHGMYTYQETPPPLGSAGPWGPIVPAVLGFALRVTGLEQSYYALPALVAGAFIVLAAAGLALMRSWSDRLFVGTVLLTFGPILLYLGSGLQEAAHLGAAIVVAVLLRRQIDDPHRATPMALSVTTVLALSLFRPTWAFMLAPVLLIFATGRGRRTWPAPLAGFAAAAAVGGAFALWCAPFPYLYFRRALEADSAARTITLVWENVRRNVDWLFNIDDVVVKTNVPQHYAVVALIVAMCALLVLRHRLQPVDRLVAWSILLPLAAILLFLMVTYDINNGTRVLAPHLLVGIVLASLSRGRWRIVGVGSVIVGVATVGWLAHDIESRNAYNYRADEASIAPFRSAIAGKLDFQRSADPWCNTVLFSSQGGFFIEMLAIPAGLGISVDLDGSFPAGELHSRWIITPETAVGQLPSTRLRQIADTPRGVLYENLDRQCRDDELRANR